MNDENDRSGPGVPPPAESSLPTASAPAGRQPAPDGGIRWGNLLVTALLIAATVIAMLQVMGGGGTKPANVGEAAPDFAVELLDGEVLSSDQLRGSWVLLDFWATWCPPCVEELPVLSEVARELADDGVILVAANQIQADSRDRVEAFVAQHLGELPDNAHVALAPDRMLRDYRVEVLPTLIFIGPDGTIRDSHRGFMSGKAVKKKLAKMMD